MFSWNTLMPTPHKECMFIFQNVSINMLLSLVHDQQCFQFTLLPMEKGLGSCGPESNEPTKNFWSWTASDRQCMCGPGQDAPQRGASSLFCPTLSFHRFGTDTSMVPHLLLGLSSTPATYSGLKLRLGSKNSFVAHFQWSICQFNKTQAILRFVTSLFSLGSICPRRHNIIGMISGVVCWKSISGLEVLSTDNAGVSQIKMDLSMSLHLVLVILQATYCAPPLTLLTSFNHWLQGRIQI